MPKSAAKSALKSARKSIGQLDVDSFLTTLGEDNEGSDDGGLDETFVTARDGNEPRTTEKKQPTAQKDVQKSTMKANFNDKSKTAKATPRKVSFTEEEDDADKQLNKKVKTGSDKSKARVATPARKRTVEQREEEEQVEDDDDEEELHRKELETLKETDPEFYEHLRKEGKDLLDFGEEDEDEAESDEGAEQDEEEPDDDTQEEQKRDLSVAALKKLEARAIRGDAVATRKLMTCFRNAVKSVLARPNKRKTRKEMEDALDRGEDLKGSGGGRDEASALQIPPEVLDRLVSTTLSRIAVGLDKILWPDKKQKLSEATSAKKRGPVKMSPHFESQQGKIKQFLGAYTLALGSREASPSIMQHLLANARLFITYYVAADREARKAVMSLIELWARPETDNASRIAAFFRLRQLSAAKRDVLEGALKDMYVQFARNAAAPKNDEAKDRMAIQARSLAEMYGLDGAVSYRIGFQHIRQLALHVRAAMASKSQESLQSVCSWKFLHCLRLWALVLASHYQALHELVFPFIQVATGTIALISAPRYTPLRLHCIDVIQVVVGAAKAGNPTYVPLALPLTQMLLLPDALTKKILPSTDTPPDLSAILRFKQDQLRKAPTRLVLLPHIVATLRKHLETYRYSVAFPELWAPVRLTLIKSGLFSNKKDDVSKGNKSKKGTESDAWRLGAEKAVRSLINDLDAIAEEVKKAREGRVSGVKRPGGPCDIDGCDKFQQSFKLASSETEKKRVKKQKPDQSEEVEDLFPSSVQEAVDEILTEASERAQAQRQDKELALIVEADEERVQRLNPDDFL